MTSPSWLYCSSWQCRNKAYTIKDGDALCKPHFQNYMKLFFERRDKQIAYQMEKETQG